MHPNHIDRKVEISDNKCVQNMFFSKCSKGEKMKVQNIYTKNAEYQRYETLKRNREKRSKQGLAFLEGVQHV